MSKQKRLEESFNRACDEAKQRSIKVKGDVYVVLDEDGYDTATDYDMETYHLGAEVVAHYYCGELF